MNAKLLEKYAVISVIMPYFYYSFGFSLYVKRRAIRFPCFQDFHFHGDDKKAAEAGDYSRFGGADSGFYALE